MNQPCSIVDAEGREVAQLAISSAEEGWYYGTILAESFPEDLRRALEWYDEVVAHQMLTFVDEAIEVLDRFHLQVKISDNGCHKAYFLQVSKGGDVSFRITPVPPPPENG